MVYKRSHMTTGSCSQFILLAKSVHITYAATTVNWTVCLCTQLDLCLLLTSFPDSRSLFYQISSSVNDSQTPNSDDEGWDKRLFLLNMLSLHYISYDKSRSNHEHHTDHITSLMSITRAHGAHRMPTNVTGVYEYWRWLKRKGRGRRKSTEINYDVLGGFLRMKNGFRL